VKTLDLLCPPDHLENPESYTLYIIIKIHDTVSVQCFRNLKDDYEVFGVQDLKDDQEVPGVQDLQDDCECQIILKY